MTGIDLRIVDLASLTAKDARAIIEVKRSVWPNEDPPLDEAARLWQAKWQGYDGPPKQRPECAVVYEGDRTVAVGQSFARKIHTTAGPFTVLALAGVACHPDFQKRGYGRAVVRAAFDRVDAGTFPACLFQTGHAKPFYETLGCTLVTNPFTDSLHLEDPNANPFWDDHIMRYPDTALWPEGKIDLLGPGY